MKVFISHSSKDKERYCNSVVAGLIQQIGEESIVYDSLSFEAGAKLLDEINNAFKTTDLFVILLSPSAVESRWVRFELQEAFKKMSDSSLNRVFPLIIDPSLNYDDKRIPEWLKDYNLKYIARPKKAAKLICERAKAVSLSHHPDYRNSKSIFVGRNELINDFERRIDDLSEIPMNTFIVSGIPNIGRKSLARQCCIKGNIIRQYYEFPTISLSYQESIEDFIIKLSDLGLTSDIFDNLPTKTMDEKVAFASALVQSIRMLTEIVLIKDDGCIVDYRGNLSDWFKKIVSTETLIGKLAFIIITRYKVNYESIRTVPFVFHINVPELSRAERTGLLKRIADETQLSLGRAELANISHHLTGYPSQVQYAVDIIKHNGYDYLSKNIKMLTNYNEQQVSSLLEQYKNDERVFQILALVAKYDAISVTMLYDILSVTDGYDECYEMLYQQSLFELEGVNKEYVRLNEVVRNYIARSGLRALPAHIKQANKIFEKMFNDSKSAWYNSNDYLLAIRENILQGKRVDSEYIIPSVYLKSMSDLYSDMKYDSVVRLARLALDNSDNTDVGILREIRYQLCSALAKLKNESFLTEVRLLEYFDKQFLTAFYYRQIGNSTRALNILNQLLSQKPDLSKAKREKVLVLKNLQEYEKAMGLAKENYYLYSDNPYHIQAYFECIINTNHYMQEKELLYDLLTKLDRIYSEKAQSMFSRCNALYLAYIEKDYCAAMKEINRSKEEFPKDRKYALSVEFDIARLYHKLPEMEAIIKEIETDGSSGNAIVICRARLLSEQGNITEAIEYFKNNIKYFTDESKEAFCKKLQGHQ